MAPLDLDVLIELVAIALVAAIATTTSSATTAAPRTTTTATAARTCDAPVVSELSVRASATMEEQVVFSSLVQIDVPDEFPLTEFESFCSAGKSLIPANSDAQFEFLGASNLIAWRFRACVENHKRFLESWQQLGVAIPHEEIYRRQQYLFSMFVCGVSTIETICYACFAVCATFPSLRLDFGEKKRRHFNLKDFRNELAQHSQTEELGNRIHTILESNQWKLWTGYRNTMTHRSALLPEIVASMGAPLPESKMLAYPGMWSAPELRGDEAIYAELLTWVADAARQLLSEGSKLKV